MHGVAMLQVDRIGLLAFADAGRRSGDNQIARLERYEAADIGQGFGDREDHGFRVAGLHALAVDIEVHVEVLRITQFIGGYQPRTGRAEGIATLALDPLRTALLLELTLGDIIDQHIAGHVVESVLDVDITAGLADDEAEFDFPVHLGRIERLHDIVIGAAQRRGRLGEIDRFRRHRQVRFGGMVGIVEANGDDLADIGDRHAIAWLAFDDRQGVQVLRLQLGQLRQAHLVGGNVTDEGREIADAAVGIDDTGLFLAFWTIAAEFHFSSP